MALTKYKLGNLISLCTGGNENLQFDENAVKGISINKEFIPTKANLSGVSLTNYTVVAPKCFSFVTVTSRNGDKISIAYNDSDQSFIVSSFYVTFRLNEFGKKVLLEEYLYIFFNRSEFDRYARRDSLGSAREYFYFENICDVEIELPDLPTQQKYVNIYKTIVANQQSYEQGLEDLKFICDGYIETLRKKSDCEKIGSYIKEIDVRNKDKKVTLLQGFCMSGDFIEPRRTSIDIPSLKILKNGEMIYNRAVECVTDQFIVSIREGETCAVSNSYIIFGSKDEKKLLNKYLLLWLRRKEFARYSKFKSHGTAHENFEFEDLCEVQIPIPTVEIQQSIVSIYSAYAERKNINEQLKTQIKNICPILIKGSLEEGDR